ncbi:cytosolic carboxypeptidase 6-like isoform X2 [Daktulosphaira vitifoliae]|uniref:cytosolic carboxypeptidase 6-like isoform X2 n=1 Tax=Daktulosphaira vitifoliae TaxID=58002 RepID=UPI0021AAD683|nr:cytosolic carboxypeptidase 6-like isoform X2 [Daktulosphaira vitifoliae]
MIDSDEGEAGLGNVTRVIMRPPGHSGKAKKGHLCFDASFETGNLGRIDLISEYEYDLYIRPDTCNPRHRSWFNFVVENTRQDQNVIFNIVNISNKNNLYQFGMTPLVRSTSRTTWSHIPLNRIHYHRSSCHGNNYVLSILFSFDKDDDSYQFAFTYPYSYSRLQNFLSVIEKKKLPFFKRELLGKSIQNRALDLITITNPKNLNSTEKVHVVVIMSRVHGADTSSSYVCQGIIEFLISNHPIVVRLRKSIVFQMIPMMNPDGVTLGNSRTNLLGIDLNRAWHKVSQWVHPTLHAVHNYLMDIDKNEKMELDLVIDVHAHSSLLGVFTYGNTYNDVYRYEKHILFPKLLAKRVKIGHEPSYTMCNRDSRKLGTSRRFLCQTLNDKVNCYTLFVSHYGYRISPKTIIPFNEEMFYTIGTCVVQTFSDYFKFTGILLQQSKVQKGLSKKERFRKRAYRRHYNQIKKKHTRICNIANKNTLTLNKVDIKDSFRDIFSDMNLEHNHNLCYKLKSQPYIPFKSTFNSKKITSITQYATPRKDNKNTNSNLFSIINIHDIIRETNILPNQ